MVVMKTREEEGGSNGGNPKNGERRVLLFGLLLFATFPPGDRSLVQKEFLKSFLGEREREVDGKSEFALIIHQSF